MSPRIVGPPLISQRHGDVPHGVSSSWHDRIAAVVHLHRQLLETSDTPAAAALAACPDEARWYWTVWCSAADQVIRAATTALKSPALDRASRPRGGTQDTVSAALEPHLAGVFQVQRTVGDLVRDLEDDLGPDVLGGVPWREAYAEMVTSLAALRRLSAPSI